MKFYLIILIILLPQCKSENRNNITYDNITTYYPIERSRLIDSIDQYIDSLEIIKLKTVDQNFINNAKKMLLTEDRSFIILYDKGIVKYDYDGNYLHNIGAIGRAAGEYIKIYDIAISFDKNEILALDNMNQVLRYDAKSGQYLGKIRTKQKESPGNFEAISPKKGNGFYLFTCNPAAVDDFENDYFCLYEFNDSGEILNKYLKRIDFVFTQGLITQNNNNKYLIRPQEGDNICYEINDDSLGIIPKYKLDFKKKYIPKKHLFSFDGEFSNKFYSFLRSDYYKIPLYFQETNDILFFSTVGPECKPVDFIINKNNGNGIRWIGSLEDASQFYFQCSDNDYLYGLYSDYRSEYEFKKDDAALKKFLVHKRKLILNTNSDPYIIKVKFKIP